MSKTSPIGAISFPHLFTPRAPSVGADERYSLSLIFDVDAQTSPEYKAMKKAALDAAEEKWGAKTKEMIQKGQIHMPFRDAAEKSDYAGYEAGKIFINPWTKQKPDVIDGRLQDVIESDVYPGCMGRITYNAFAWEVSGKRGVSIGLNNVQISDFSSPRLDGHKAGKDDFDQLDTTDQTDKELEDEDLPF